MWLFSMPRKGAHQEDSTVLEAEASIGKAVVRDKQEEIHIGVALGGKEQ